MLTRNWRRGFATALTLGILAAGASAQEGAQGDVTIKDKTPAPVVQPSTGPSSKPAKPTIADRDPFINQIVADTLAPGPRSNPLRRQGDSNVSHQNPKPQPPNVQAREKAPQVAQVPAPDVTVNGIVSSGGGRQAIISTGAGSRLITQGQKLGDYRVSAIGPNYVSFAYGSDKVFKVSITDEFAK